MDVQAKAFILLNANKNTISISEMLANKKHHLENMAWLRIQWLHAALSFSCTITSVIISVNL